MIIYTSVSLKHLGYNINIDVCLYVYNCMTHKMEYANIFCEFLLFYDKE